ncbi:MAG TPA: response regulator [Pseudomonadales bacterium]
MDGEAVLSALQGDTDGNPDARDVKILIVDDDEDFARTLELILGREGFRVSRYPSAERFLAEADLEPRACLLLDVHLPQMSGVELQEELNRRRVAIPVVFMSGQSDVPTSVRALKGGAVDFLEKPFDYDALRQALATALEHERRLRESEHVVRRARAVRRRYERLTEREREVLELVVDELTSSQVAERLGLSRRTVEHHREHIMDKLGARSTQHLLLMAVLCGICKPHERVDA